MRGERLSNDGFWLSAAIQRVVPQGPLYYRLETLERKTGCNVGLSGASGLSGRRAGTTADDPRPIKKGLWRRRDRR